MKLVDPSTESPLSVQDKFTTFKTTSKYAGCASFKQMLTAADQADTPKVEERNKDSTNLTRFLNYFFSSRGYDIMQL